MKNALCLANVQQQQQQNVQLKLFDVYLGRPEHHTCIGL